MRKPRMTAEEKAKATRWLVVNEASEKLHTKTLREIGLLIEKSEGIEMDKKALSRLCEHLKIDVLKQERSGGNVALFPSDRRRIDAIEEHLSQLGSHLLSFMRLYDEEVGKSSTLNELREQTRVLLRSVGLEE